MWRNSRGRVLRVALMASLHMWSAGSACTVRPDIDQPACWRLSSFRLPQLLIWANIRGKHRVGVCVSSAQDALSKCQINVVVSYFCIYSGFMVSLNLYIINLSVCFRSVISNQWWVVRKSDWFSCLTTTQNKTKAHSSTRRSGTSTLPGRLPQCTAMLHVLPPTHMV